MSSQFISLMLGAIAMCCIAVAVFFLRYFQVSRERLFLFFAVAFFIEGINRAVLALSANPQEGEPLIYGIRLLAYVLILFGILDKNRRDG